MAKLIKYGTVIYVRDLDPMLSLLSASYKLMKAYADRFWKRHRPGPIEYTWNIHHEDWMWAHATIVYTVKRRFGRADAFKTPMPGTP